MDIVDSLNTLIDQPTAYQLNQGEQVINHAVGDYLHGKRRRPIVATFDLTNMRLMIATDQLYIKELKGIEAINNASNAAQGRPIGNWSIDRLISELPKRGFIYLGDIATLTPGKYQPFAMLPFLSRQTLLSVTDRAGLTLPFIINHRDEWLTAITQAKNAYPNGTGQGWQLESAPSS